MKSGIYKITNTQNNKIYIGKSADVAKRKKAHLDNLRAGTHINPYLQEDFDTFGENNFTFEVLEYVPIKELDRKESFHCYENNVWEKGYNIAKLSDYSKMSTDTAVELGIRIIRNIITKNPTSFETEEVEFKIPIHKISNSYGLENATICISLKEALKKTDEYSYIDGWEVRLNHPYLQFVNCNVIENNLKSISFF